MHEGAPRPETHPQEESQEDSRREAYLVVKGSLSADEDANAGDDNDVDLCAAQHYANFAVGGEWSTQTFLKRRDKHF